MELLDRALLAETKHLFSLQQISYPDMGRVLRYWRPIKEFSTPGVYLLLAHNEETGELALYIGCSILLNSRLAVHGGKIAKAYKLIASNSSLMDSPGMLSAYDTIVRPGWQLRCKVLATFPKFPAFSPYMPYIVEGLLASDGMFATVTHWYDTQFSKQSTTSLPALSERLAQADLGFTGTPNGFTGAPNGLTGASNTTSLARQPHHIRLNKQSPFAQPLRSYERRAERCEAAPEGEGAELFGAVHRSVIAFDADEEECQLVVCENHYRRAHRAGQIVTDTFNNTPCMLKRRGRPDELCEAAPEGEAEQGKLNAGSLWVCENHYDRWIKAGKDDELLNNTPCRRYKRKA